MQKPDKRLKKYIFLIVFAMILFAMALNIKDVLRIVGVLFAAISPVLAGLAIAFILNIPLSFFQNKVFGKLKNSPKKFLKALNQILSIVLTLVVVIALLTAIFAIIIPVLFDAIKNIMVNIDKYAETVPIWLSKLADKFNIPKSIKDAYTVDRQDFITTLLDYLKLKSTELIAKTATVTMSVISTVTTFFLSVVVAIYALVCKSKLKRFLSRLLHSFTSEEFTRKTIIVANTAYRSFSGFISGQLIENIILGILCYIGMTIFGFPYAGAISVIVATAQLIPVIGGIVSATAGSLLMLTISPINALLFLIFIIIIQQIEGNLIYPKIVGDKVGSSSFSLSSNTAMFW